MTPISRLSTLALVFALAACGTSEDRQSRSEQKGIDTQAQMEKETEKAAEEMAASEEDTKSMAEDLMDKAGESAGSMADAILSEGGDLIDDLTLDTSSLTNFQDSLGAMTDSLDVDQASMLQRALSTLAKQSAGGKGGALGAATSLATGKSMEETLYENMKDQLDGKNFQDILALAG